LGYPKSWLLAAYFAGDLKFERSLRGLVAVIRKIL